MHLEVDLGEEKFQGEDMASTSPGDGNVCDVSRN